MIRVGTKEDEYVVITSMRFIVHKESKPNFPWTFLAGREDRPLVSDESQLIRNNHSYGSHIYIMNQQIGTILKKAL